MSPGRLVVPTRPVLVYDADCGFCARTATVTRRWVDRRERYDIRGWQELDLGLLGLTPEQCDTAAQFVDSDSSAHAAHRAIAGALIHGAPAWRPLGRLLLAPGVSDLAARVYAWVAGHRHRLPGGTGACAPPSGRATPGARRRASTGPVHRVHGSI